MFKLKDKFLKLLLVCLICIGIITALVLLIEKLFIGE